MATIELPHLHSAALGCFVRVGSRFESESEAGLSHFVEHMLHRGTERHADSLALHHAIDDIGADLVADTGPSFSRFVLSIDPAELEAAMALLGDIIGRPTWTDLELERELVLEELDAAGDDEASTDLARALFFGADHPLARPVLGTRRNVSRFEVDDVAAFHRRFYNAGNMLVVAAGPLQADAVAAAAATSFADIGAGAAVPLTPTIVEQDGARVRFAGKDERVDVTALFRAEGSAALRPALTALSYAIDGGMSSRLHYRICDQRGLAYEVGASMEQLEDLVLLDIGAETSSTKVIDLLDEVLEIAGELATDRLGDDELDRIRRLHRLDVVSMLDAPEAMASRVGSRGLYGDVPDVEQLLAEMDALDPETVREAACGIFRPDRLAVAVTGRLSAATRGQARALVKDWRAG